MGVDAQILILPNSSVDAKSWRMHAWVLAMHEALISNRLNLQKPDEYPHHQFG